MKGLGLGSKNMLFVFRFSCLFTKKHKKTAKIAKIAVLQNLRFPAVPSPIDLKLGGDIRTSTTNSMFVSFILLFVYIS